MYFTTFLRVIMSLILAVLSLLPAKLGLPVGPAVIFDASELTGEVTNGASGYLYGLAEDGVPSYNMVESLDISSVSAKTQGGLQHPIGEVGDVANELTVNGKCDYIVVYLQDMYSTWYYDHQNITEMKKNGTYDWKEYVQNTYFPLIEQTVSEMKDAPYADKLVYCIYNECDNGIWFGEWVPTEDGNGWHNFNEQGRQNFYEAWKMTVEYVKSLDPNARIGGPGNFEYNTEKMDTFLKYTSENNCVPEVLIYHELNDYSIYNWEVNVEELRGIEAKYGVSVDTPIIITEYGRMQDNGDPNMMLKYIARTENTKVYSNQAYWLLADNLCNTAADYNTPNSAWWVYRWYTNMSGQTMDVEVSDILHADVEKSIKEKREPRNQHLLGVGSLTDGKDKVEMLVSGTDYKTNARVKNLDTTALYGKNVRITVSSVTYQGIAGMVFAPEVVKTYTQTCGKTVNVQLPAAIDRAYHIEITPDDSEDEFFNSNLYTRYEFEHGTLLGGAYTYDSAYATTGDQNGMVGGMEKEGDGVEITISVPSAGDYELRFIYGNSKDGDERTYSKTNLSIDGNETVLSLANTIRSELTSAYDMTVSLTKGTHTIRFTHNTGTIVLDSVLVRAAEDVTEIYSEKDNDRASAYLAIAPDDGYYAITTAKNAEILVDGAKAVVDANGKAAVYLRRGLNFIDVPENASFTASVCDKTGDVIVLEPSAAVLDGASIAVNEKTGIEYYSGISSNGGSAQYSVTVPAAGTYKLTILYSNNRENGVHDYNVDLVEDYVTISVNGEKQQNLYCRNTYSNDTFTTVTTNIELTAGENTVTFTNDGANQFNGNETFVPNVSTVTVNPVQAY